ncbi:hypothetical protein CsSME_00002823 [Camellia sinensis var. sinensis]
MLPTLLCHVHQIHDWATRVLYQAGVPLDSHSTLARA